MAGALRALAAIESQRAEQSRQINIKLISTAKLILELFIFHLAPDALEKHSCFEAQLA